MTANDLNKLRALAEAATPGPWGLQQWKNSAVAGVHSDHPVPGGTFVAETSGADAAFIAAVNPVAVLALLDEIAAAQAALQGIHEHHTKDIARLCAEKYAAEKRLARYERVFDIARRVVLRGLHRRHDPHLKGVLKRETVLLADDIRILAKLSEAVEAEVSEEGSGG